MRKPSKTNRGTTMHSRIGESGSFCFTTRRPSVEMVAMLRYRFTSLMLVSFFEGYVPWIRWALVRRKSGHSDSRES